MSHEINLYVFYIKNTIDYYGTLVDDHPLNTIDNIQSLDHVYSDVTGLPTATMSVIFTHQSYI